MKGESADIKQQKIEELKKIFPEAVSEGKIDIEKLKLTLGKDINIDNERYVLNWAGKSDVFKVLQTPTSATLVPDKKESVDFDKTNHVFIEGENLEVLKILQKSYFGKIKMIYIDPPYNTGNDNFIYPDRFSESKEEYQMRIGDKDAEGYMTKEGLFQKNSKDGGHYHSNWLSMMYPRLFLARNLLKNDGVIFISIDDNEVHNLRMLMNEIYGEENFIEQLVWKKRYQGAKEKYIVAIHEYILIYSKNKNNLLPFYIPSDPDYIKKYYKFKDKNYEKRGAYRTQPLEAGKSMENRKNLVYSIKAPDGSNISPKRQWVWGKDRVLDALKHQEIEFNKGKNNNWTIAIKQYLKDRTGEIRQTKPFSIINDIYTQHGTAEIADLFGSGNIFTFPKPSELLKQVIQIILDENNEIILDFFAGSAPIAQAVFNLNSEQKKNNQFICIQLPELTDEKSEACQAGYKTIADIGKERIRRVIKKIKKEQKDNKDLFSDIKEPLDLGFKVFKLKESNFNIWKGDKIKNEKQLAEKLDGFIDAVSVNATEENMLYELLLKSGVDLNAKIQEKDGYYIINDNEMVIALSKIDEKTAKFIIDLKPQKVIVLDKLFKKNDQLKTNTALQMKDTKIDFWTI